MKCLRLAILIGVFFNNDCLFSEENILSGHPRESYSDVKNIDEMEDALRDSLASIERHSFSRGWWVWDRLRCRYVDGGRKDSSALRVLRAVFRGLLLDRHKKLEEKGEGDLLYIFYTSLTGDRKESTLNVNGRKVFRDVHGGGYHGGWGGAARMRIYEELSSQKMLSAEEEVRFEKIVKQSLEPRFIDFKKKAQSANNHSFGNAGGIALALDLFPDAPQADEARAWIDRIWKHLSEFGDWTEWNYYPYGPIFLHGLIDIAEVTGRIDSEKELINAVGNRCLGFIHGGGVRGNPNCGSVVRDDLELVYKDPWNYGYYDVETSARDGHFWYRLAKHYKNPKYLWAAEQVSLGGRPLNGEVSNEYNSAYERRFSWFIDRDIKPMTPNGGARIGLLSSRTHKIPERLYLNRDRKPGSAFASIFLYPEKDEHLDNVSGHIYEYSVSGSKYLHTSGKYNNVYSGKDLRGGGTGEESLDLFLVIHNRHQFPLHPDRKGDARDFMRRGSIKHDVSFVRAENNKFGDSYGRFAFDNYYGEGSRWERRVVLTREGFFIVLDRYRGGEILREDYLAGPVWHVGFDGAVKEGGQSKNWFDFPPLDNAWWKKNKSRALLISHPHSKAKYGLIKQRNSQDTSPNVTLYSYRPVSSSQDEYFLNVFVPYDLPVDSSSILKQTKTHLDSMGNAKIDLGHAGIEILIDESWSVVR